MLQFNRYKLVGETDDFHIRFGMLVNAVLNNPGPLHLDDERLPGEMARMVGRYLGIDA